MKALTSHIEQKRLLQVLNYDPATGVFTWKAKASKKCVIGRAAGCSTPAGYIRITIDGVPHMAHRLAWQFVHGTEAPSLIDHRNRVRSDNRIENLRLASDAQNAHNAVWGRPNKEGHRGIYWNKRLCKWVATIRDGSGKRQHLGCFDDSTMGGQAYAEAKLRRHSFATAETIAADLAAGRGGVPK
jgi:hypothetical protein